MPHCRFKVKNDYERRITYTWPYHLPQFNNFLAFITLTKLVSIIQHNLQSLISTST